MGYAHAAAAEEGREAAGMTENDGRPYFPTGTACLMRSAGDGCDVRLKRRAWSGRGACRTFYGRELAEKRQGERQGRDDEGSCRAPKEPPRGTGLLQQACPASGWAAVPGMP